MAIIIPNDILKDPDKLSTMCHNHDEPIFLTKDGYGDLVAMSQEVFDRLEKAVIREEKHLSDEHRKLLNAIDESKDRAM